MPLVRYAIQNEYKLGNLEFYRTASKDDPKSMLEGVTMVGLVGILRQLGDLAEFAAELFHDLHEEIMATAARGHDLVARVLQLEAEVPYIEKVLSDSDPLRFCSMPGVDWHATIRSDQNHFTQGDLPRFIRSSYEECRGPPRLFLLDKFDIGAEACLRRYTDPSFFKRQWASTELTKAEKAQQERKARSRKKKAIRRTNIEDIYNPALAPRLKPRRVRYSSLSSDNLDCFLDSSSLLSTGNQFNSSFKPMDTVSITENNENLPFNAMSISVLKEPTPPSSISQTAGLIVNKAKDPAEAVIVEALIMASKGKELKEERRRTLGSSSKVNEEQSMLDKEEGKGSLEAFSLKKIASNFSIDSDRFEDAMTAQSETDSDIVKLNFTDNDDDNDNKDNFTLQVRDAECNSKVDFTQETGPTSVTTQHFVSESVDLGRLAQNSGILQAHSENLKKSVSGVTSEIDIYEDAMNTHSGIDSEAGANQVISVAFSDKHSEMRTISTTFLQHQEDNEGEISSPQVDRSSVHIQKVFLLESSHLGAVGNQTIIQDLGASKLDVSKDKEDNYNTESVDDAIITKFDSSLAVRNQLLTVDIQAGQVESMSLSTADCMLNKHVEVLAKEEFLPDAVKSRERLSWKTSETSIDRGFVKDLNVPSENVIDLKELISNSSSDLDTFEDAVGAELDTGSQATSMQELNDISSLQGIPAKIVCTTTPFLEFCNDNKIEPVQNIPEDRMQDILEGDGWRQGDFPTSTPEPTDKNEVYSSYLGKRPLDPMNEKRDALGKLLHLDTSSASDDLCETKNKCLQASDLASKLHGACDGKLTQLDDTPPQTMVSNGTGLPNDLVSKEQPVAETIKPEEVTDNILVGQTGFADGNTPEQPDSLASVLAVGKDGLVSVADFRVHTRQTMGSKSGISKSNTHIEGTEEEDFEEDFGTDNEPDPHMIKTGGKHDHLSLLKPLYVTTNPQTDMLCSSDAEVVETVSAYSDWSGPTSVPFKLGSYDPSYSRTSSENYREDHSVQDSSIKEGSQSQGLEYSDLLIAKPAAHVDALLNTDVRISTQWSKSELQSKSKDSFLPFISRSPPLSPISSFELPAGVHKLHGKVRDAKDENSMLLHMDQTARPKLTLDVTPDDSPAISPIVSPMWSSESPTACDEPQKMFAQDQDERLPSQSPSLPSSPASPTTPREQHDFISDAELKHSVRSSPRDAILNTLASSTISVPSEGLSSGCIDKKGVSPFQLTSSPLLSAMSPPTFPASQNSQVDNFDEERKISMVLSCEPTLNNGELLIPLSESLPSEDSELSLNKPKPDVLGQVIQPTPLAIKESPIREVGTSSLRMKSGSASPDSVKSPSRTSKDQVPSNEAGESFLIKSMSVSPELGSTTPSSVKLEAHPLPSFSGETSTTCEELSISTEATPAPPAPPASTPPRKPPKSFHGLSRESTTNPSPGDHRRDIVDSISMSSLSKLRKVSIQAPPPKPRNVNDREVLLEQIRTQSFNLRHTTVKKRELPSRPVPNINVAAILEKAYSMRQAVVGSDEDRDSDGWSDQ